MKRKLINSFIILSISSTLAKIFSILNRIILSRQLSSEAMALYILVMPTVSLSNCFFPQAIHSLLIILSPLNMEHLYFYIHCQSCLAEV